MGVQASVSTTQKVVSLEQGVKLIQAFSNRLLKEHAPTARVRLPITVLRTGKTTIEEYIQFYYSISNLQDHHMKAKAHIEYEYGPKLLGEFRTEAPQNVLENWTPTILHDLGQNRLLRPAPLELVNVKGLEGLKLDYVDISGFNFRNVEAPKATFYGSIALAETIFDGGVFKGIEVSHANWVGAEFINNAQVQNSYFHEVTITPNGIKEGDFTDAIGLKTGGMRFVKPQPETIQH